MEDKEQSTLPDPQPTLKNWDILAKVDANFLDRVKYFHGFQTYLADTEERKQSAFLITTDDEVYAIGHNNEDNLLALSGDNFAKPIEVQKPKKINELSGKGIIKLTVSERFGAALTYDGKFIYWGMKMENIQYEEYRKQYVTLPQEPRANLNVTDISCGAHSIILKTDKNEMIIWGCINIYYSEFYTFKKLPVRKNAGVEAISSGWYHIALLNKDGQVWTFGYGSVGQLGYKWYNQDGFTTPVKVSLPDECVKVECGAYSTLFLLKNGEVYACGSNSKSDHLCVGQLGYVSKPLKVLLNVPIKDISATYAWSSKTWQSVFAAQDTDGKFYRWGDDSSISSPQVTDTARSMFDVFANFKIPQALGDLKNNGSVRLIDKQKTTPTSTSSDSSILSKWSVFDGIDKDFIRKIKYFTLLDDFPSFTHGRQYSAFVVTTNEEVYGLGFSGSRNTLGLTENSLTEETYETPVLISKLSKKKIRKIILNLNGCGALSEDGLVYTWGKGNLPTIVEELSNTPVKDMVRGSTFFLYLLQNGEVYLNGQVGSGYSSDGYEKIVIPNNETIVSIEAGDWHYAVLSSTSQVYTYGQGSFDPFYDWQDDEAPFTLYTLKKETLPDSCKMVACGVTATYFLTVKGELYACGANYTENIHVGHSGWVTEPEKVLISDSVAEICATKKYLPIGSRAALAAVKTVSGKIIRWGGKDSEPTEVEGATTLIEAFEDSSIPDSLSMVHLETPTDDEDLEVEIRTITETNLGINLLGDPLYSDVTIKLSDGVISAHKVLLYKNSAFFRKVIQKYEETNQQELDLSKYNPKAIRAMLKFIYGIQLGLRASATMDLLDFRMLAQEDGGEKILNKSKTLLTDNTFFELLSSYAKMEGSTHAQQLLDEILPTRPFP